MQNGQFAAKLGSGPSEWGRVITWAERGLKRQGLRREREGYLRYWLGLALYETGDLYRAEQELRRVVELGESVRALAELQADGCYRLGLVHRLLRRPDREVAAFRRAARLHMALGSPERTVQCFIDTGWSLLLAGRETEALPELEAAAAGLTGVDAPDLEIHLRILRALSLSLTGDRQASDGCCLDLLNSPPLQPWQRAEVAWILGCNALERGDRTAAELHGAIAYEHGLQAWWPPQMDRIAQLRRRLASADGESSPSSPRG